MKERVFTEQKQPLVRLQPTYIHHKRILGSNEAQKAYASLIPAIDYLENEAEEIRKNGGPQNTKVLEQCFSSSSGKGSDSIAAVFNIIYTFGSLDFVHDISE